VYLRYYGVDLRSIITQVCWHNISVWEISNGKVIHYDKPQTVAVAILQFALLHFIFPLLLSVIMQCPLVCNVVIDAPIPICVVCNVVIDVPYPYP